MLCLSVDFHCQLQTSGLYSAYKGSMLRGALGHHLRRGLCMTRQDDCGVCMLAANCIFPRVFSAPISTVADSAAPLLPPPFCIEPPLDHKRAYEAGESFIFTLKLFSYTVDYLPYFVHAFHMAGERGLGSGQGAGRFRLADIHQEGESIFDAAAGQLQPRPAKNIPLPRLIEASGEKELSLRLLTPLRFKAANHLAAQLEFPALINLILRRARSLWALDGLHACMEPQEFAGMREEAARVRATASNLAWHDWNRYSNRQGAAMKLGGLLGEARYAGNIGAFQEFLDFARIVHIGKQTSFGLGAMDFSLQ